MFRIKYKQKNIQRRIVIALTLICLLVGAINVQLYFEYRILARVVTSINRLDQHENYFDMSLPELMEVVVVSKLEEQPRSHLLNFNCYYPGWGRELG